MWLCRLPASYQHFLLYKSPGVKRFILFLIFWPSLSTDIFIIFSQPGICRTGTRVCRHVAVPFAGKLLAFLPYMSPGIMSFTLFIIFQHSLYTDIFIIFSQPSSHSTGTGVCRHVAVPVAGELPVFLLYIS